MLASEYPSTSTQTSGSKSAFDDRPFLNVVELATEKTFVPTTKFGSLKDIVMEKIYRNKNESKKTIKDIELLKKKILPYCTNDYILYNSFDILYFSNNFS